jgi:PAS domain S-box-containing protein
MVDLASRRPPWRSSRLWSGLALVAIPALMVVGAEVYQLARNIPELRRSQKLVEHTVEVITTAQALERAVQDGERGQRGFLITGDPAYLQPYQAGVQVISADFAKLKQLTADNPKQQYRLASLAQQLKVKLDELKSTIDARRTEGFDAARRIVETNVGADAMHAIDEILNATESTEYGLLHDREMHGQEAARRTAIISMIGGAIALIIISAGGAIVLGNFRRLSRSQQQLWESEERFRLLISGIGDYAIYMLDPAGNVVLWNYGAERLKGYRSEEIIGRHFSCFYTSEDIQSGTPDRALQRAADDGNFATEGWRVRQGGSRFWATVVITAIRDEQGNLRGFAKLIRDDTKRKESETALVREVQERQRAEAMLRQAQKMDVLGRLTGGIAHDFNNMLAVIVGGLEILERRLQTDDPRIVDPIRSAFYAAERSAALTRGLLAFSRQQPLEPKPIDVNKLVGAMSGLIKRTLGENIDIETVLAAGLWTTLADMNQLESALLNLAVNARDAMPHGGKLTIETENTYLDEAYARDHVEVRPGQYVMIAVTDTGIGMSSETTEKAFEPFFTTKEAGQGTGLGLSQVYGFVTQTGGHIKIYSELGQGTTVKLYLLRSTNPDISLHQKTEQPPLSVQPRSAVILVVEDNELLLTSVAEALSEEGYRVLTALNAATALQLLGQHKVQLLFTDVGLPGGVSGRQLADMARGRHPNLAVLFTTGYTRNAIIHQGRLDPGIELIVKPFTYAALIAKIQHLLEQRGN